jgi:hypothetical protein
MYGSFFAFFSIKKTEKMFRLKINEEGPSEIPKLSQEAEYINKQEMNQTDFIDEIQYLVSTKNMDNWNLAGYMLLLASKHFIDEPELYDPGTFEDFKNIRPFKSKKTLRNFYDKLKSTYEENSKIEPKTILVEYDY